MAPRSSAFAGARLAREVLASMQGMERRMMAAFIRSVEAITDDPELLALLREIQAGNFMAMTPGVEERIARINIGEDDLVEIARKAMAQAGRVTTKTTGLEMSFDITNPRAVQAARTLGAELVTNVSNTTRTTIRNLIADVIEGNQSLAEAKKIIRQRAGLLPQHAEAVKRYRDNLVTSGTKAQQANKMADKYARRLLKYRAEMIARTEVSRAMSLGQTETWNQARDNDLIPPDTLRVWITTPDERLCSICGPMDGETATLDGVWDTMNGQVSYPSAIHPQCRCSSGLVFTNTVGKVDPLAYDYWRLERLSRIAKGDYPGHPFRGNQWVQFPAGRMIRTGRQRVDETVDGLNIVELEAEDVEYSNSLERLRKECHGGKTLYLVDEDGSFYDEIDWDSDVDPVEQMTLSFEEFTGINVDRNMDVDISELSVEAVAEVYDAVAAMQAEWGTAPQVITFKNTKSAAHVSGEGATHITDYEGNRRMITGDLDREFYGHMNFKAYYMTEEGSEALRRAIFYDHLVYQERGISHNVPNQLTPHQAMIVHEYGHIVHNWSFTNNPGGLWNVATTMVESSAAATGGRVTVRSSPKLNEAWAMLDGASRAIEMLRADGKTTSSFSVFPEALPTGSTGSFNRYGRRVSSKGTVYLSDGSPVSQYSNTNGVEMWSETFLLVYGNPSGGAPALKSSGSRVGKSGNPYYPQEALTQIRSAVLEAFNENY